MSLIPPRPECDACGRPYPEDSRKEYSWWTLQGYSPYHITGAFCPDCMDMVSHDYKGNPKNPEKFTYFLLKYQHLIPVRKSAKL